MANSPFSLGSALFKLNKVLSLDKKDLGAVYVFSILIGLVQLSLPLGIQSIISFVLAGSISTSIVVLIGLVVFGVFINGLLQVRQLQIIEKIKQKLFVRYSLEFSDRLPRLNIEKLDNVYLPEMVNRYFDSVSLQKGIDKLLVDLPAALIQVVFGVILLAFYHPIFIAFGLVLILIVVLVLRFSSRKGLETAMDASSYKYGVAAWLQEIARTIKSFKYAKTTSMHMHRTDHLVGEYLDSRTSHFKILVGQFWSLISFKILITAAMLIIGSYLLVNQQINIGQFIAADIVIIAIIASIEKLITNLDTVYDALVSVEKLSVVTEAEIEKSGNMTLADRNEGVRVEFRDVNFAYPNQQPVLKNIDFTVHPGQMVQISGASGSGKSTILRLLTGAFSNYNGDILIDNAPAGNYDMESLRSHTGILLGSQDIFLGSLWQNLVMGDTKISMDEVNRLADITGLSDYIQSSKEGYDTVLLPVGKKLSNGVRKNILLIRALVGQHRLLLLEEPFEHLEDPIRTRVIEYVKHEMNATVIVTSQHDHLKPWADQVIRLTADGEIAPIQ